MKKRLTSFLVLFLVLSCSLFGLAGYTNARQINQYAYIGSYHGIFEFGIKSDGSLKPLQSQPVTSGLYLDQLLIDPGTKTVYGISVDNKLYSYAIDKLGHLSLKSAIPFESASGSATLDLQEHFLYASRGNNEILVYDILNPSHIIRRQNLKISIRIQSICLDQPSRSLFVLGERQNKTGQTIGGVLLRYALCHRHQQNKNQFLSSSTHNIPSTLAIAGNYLVAGNFGNSLTVYKISNKKRLYIVSQQSIVGINPADTPSRIAYRKNGSFLYVSVYNGTQSARVGASPHTIIAYYLSCKGQLRLVSEVGHPVSNPRPFLDNTGRFLYIVGEESSIDMYKIASNGQLSDCGSRLKIDAPTNVVFIGGTKSKD